MRLSELVNINITDIHDNGTIRIVGKGNKERLVYLNDACNTALRRLCDERAKLPNLQDKKLFLFPSIPGSAFPRGVSSKLWTTV